MSIGPLKKDEVTIERLGVAERISTSTKKTLTAFFIDPIHYIFYGALALGFIGIFAGMDLTWRFYTLLSLVGLVKLLRSLGAEFNKIDDGQ